MSNIYGSPLWLSSGGGSNDTLPPLLDGFQAVRREGAVVLSAEKLENRRAKDLAGAIWVYGDHEPKNVNDGTKIELTREEIIRADGRPHITLADIPASDAKTETIVNLKESDGKLHPYLYLLQNYETSGRALLLRQRIGSSGTISVGWGDANGGKYHQWCNDTFLNTILDASVAREISYTNIPLMMGVASVKVFALSKREYGETDSYYQNEGTPIPYFSSPQKRIAYQDMGGICEHYTRTNVTAAITYIDRYGAFQATSNAYGEPKGLRPAFCLPYTFKLNATPNEDGSYDMYEEVAAASALPAEYMVERSIAWEQNKDFYARQFTYNSKKQHQTMLEGAIASLLPQA